MAVVDRMDLAREHRYRRIRRCPCGERHTRNSYLYLRDERQRIVNPGGELGAIISGWRGRQLPYEQWPLNRGRRA